MTTLDDLRPMQNMTEAIESLTTFRRIFVWLRTRKYNRRVTRVNRTRRRFLGFDGWNYIVLAPLRTWKNFRQVRQNSFFFITTPHRQHRLTARNIARPDPRSIINFADISD
jgi:hypothetical protein